MRRSFFFFLPVLIFVHGAWASSPDVVQNTQWLQNLGNRADGTEAEKIAFEHVAEHLKSLDISFSRIPLDSSPRGHSFSENLVAEIPGRRAGIFILAAPMDGGAFSVSVLMEIASRLSASPPENTVILAFLGAERGESPFHPYGSRQVVDAYNQPGNTFALYLESENIPASWHVKPGGGGKVAPYWLLKAATQALFSNTVPFRLRGTDIQVARFGLQGDIGALETWIEADMPALLLKGNGISDEWERIGTVDSLLSSISDIDESTIEIPSDPQRTYLFIRPLPGLNPQIVPEFPYVLVFLTISALLMVTILLRIRTVQLNLKRFARFWWSWPLLLMVVFLFLFLSTLIVEETILLADFPDIWAYAPGVFVFFKLAIAAGLSLVFILITRGLPLPRNPHFYSYSAIFTSILTSLVFIALNITLAAYSLWTVICLLIFVSIRNPNWKNILLFFSLIPHAVGLAVIVGEPYTEIIRSLLLSRINGSLMLTLILYPIVLIISSINYHKHHYQRSRSNRTTSAATLLISLSALVTLTWILNLNIFNSRRPQTVVLIDNINLSNGDRRLEIVSPAPIGNATLRLDGREYMLEDLGRRAEVRMPFNRNPLTVDSESRNFLGRRSIRTTLSGEANPAGLVVTLRSDRPYTLHEANYPYEMSPSGTSAEIFIGDNPPFPITLRFTVNGDASLILTAIAKWNDPADPPTIDGKSLSGRSKRTARLETGI